MNQGYHGPRWTDWNIGQTGEMGVVPRDMSLADTQRLRGPDDETVARMMFSESTDGPAAPGHEVWSSGGPTTSTTVTLGAEPGFDKWLRRIALLLAVFLMCFAIVSGVTAWILINDWADHLADPSLWNTTEPLLPRN